MKALSVFRLRCFPLDSFDLLDQPLGEAENRMWVSFWTNVSASPICVGKGILVIAHLGVVFGKTGFP